MKAFDIELTPCDVASARTFAELDAVAFPSSPGTVGERAEEVLTDPRCPVDRYFLARVGDTVVGGFRILPLEMKVANHAEGWVQVGGLGRIGVYPHFRRLGYAGGVMRLVLQRSYAQGDVVSLLYPSTFAIYRKYGYGIAAHHVLYSVPPSAFPESSERENIRPATVDDWEAINHCYESQIHGSLGILRRSKRVWNEYYMSRSTEQGYAHWLYEDDNGPQAYISTWYEPTSKYYFQRLHVTEWFVSSHVALRACLGFFRAQSANIEVVKLPTPVSYGLETALVEPVWAEDPDLAPWHQPVGKLCSTLMGRIVRIRDAVAARSYAENGSVNLLVEDWSLPENSGYFSLHTRGGRGELTKAAERDADIRLDIAVLSSLYFGSLTAQQAFMYGLLEASPEATAQLDRMLGNTRFMIWDFF